MIRAIQHLLLAVVALLIPTAAHGAFDVFLQLTPANGTTIPGETADPLYSGWMEVMSFGAGSTKSATFTSAGATITPATFQKFTLVKKAGEATGAIFQRLSAGSLFATIRMVVAQRERTRVELWDLQATTCMLAGQTLDATKGGEILETVTFVAAAIEWRYMVLNAAGDPVSERYSHWSTMTGSGSSSAATRAPDYLGGVDTDNDGLPDGWELLHGFDRHTADASLDADSDGFDNLQEYIAHTDPRKAESGMRLTAVQPGPPGSYNLSWEGVTGLVYRIQSASSPAGPWTVTQTVTATTNGTQNATVGSLPDRQFFRVVTP